MKKKELQQLISEEFEFLSTLSVQEYTLYKKWEDINIKYPLKLTALDKFMSKNSSIACKYPMLKTVKDNIWIPESSGDFLKLQPKVIPVTKKCIKEWTLLRDFAHTLVWKISPGRHIKYLVIDEVTGKYLGIFSFGSDFVGITSRDKYIGWTYEDKFDHHMIDHTIIANTLVPMQPLGYNYLGGKLITLLSISDRSIGEWNKRYPDKIYGVTTTSLYGGYSQYNNLKYWKKCDSTTGKLKLEPSEKSVKLVFEYLKENNPDEYWSIRNSDKSQPRLKLIDLGMRKLGIKRPINNFSRGVYFSCLYDNTKELLTRKTDKVGEKRFDDSVDNLVELWKTKYAKKRITRLLEDNRIKNVVLFYDEMIGISWEETKEKYLGDVGR